MDTIVPEDMGGCDALVHLASPGVSPKPATWKELTYWNIHVSSLLAEIAMTAGIHRLVVAGTCFEYGLSGNDFEFLPVDAPLRPTTPYAVSKAAGFQALEGYARHQKLELYYGRIFNAYGPGQYEKNFWPSLCTAAQIGDDFPMTSGNQVRDFVDVKDVVARLLDACSLQAESHEWPIIENIGTGMPQTLAEFASGEWKRLHATGNLLIGALQDRANDVSRMVASLTIKQGTNRLDK